MAKFVGNNNNSISTRLFLFFALKRLYLCISFDIIDFSDFIIRKRLNKKKAINIFKAI